MFFCKEKLNPALFSTWRKYGCSYLVLPLEPIVSQLYIAGSPLPEYF